MRIAIIIIWLILGLAYFLVWDYGRGKCCPPATESEIAAPITKPETAEVKKVLNLPLAFYWAKKEVVQGKGFKEYRDSILMTLKNGEILEITGYYREEEGNNTSFGDLGLARANEIRKLFPEIPDDRIRLFSRKVNEKSGERNGVFASSAIKSAVNNKNVQEVQESAYIYFKYNSVSKLDNKNITSYLDKVAKRVIKTGEKIKLTGHTDDRGDRAYNYMLGKKRAQYIKNYLVSRGVPPNQIIVESKGEDEPLVPNTTPANRAKNRRVELKILNQ